MKLKNKILCKHVSENTRQQAVLRCTHDPRETVGSNTAGRKKESEKAKISNKTTRRLKRESQVWLTDSGSQTDSLPPPTSVQNSWRKQWQNCGQCTRTHRTYSLATCLGCFSPLGRTYVIAHVSSRTSPPSYFATCPLRLPFLPYKFPPLPCVLSFKRRQSLLQTSEKKNKFIL